MSDLNEDYLTRRSYQLLVNSGAGADIGRTLTPEMRETPGGVTKVGVDREAGVAVEVENYRNVDITGPGTFDWAGAEEKARLTGTQNLREENGYFVGENEALGKVVLGRVAQADGTEGGVGEFLGNIETMVSAPVTGVLRGLAKFGANVLGGVGAIDQEEADKFSEALDRLNEIASRDSTAASVVGTAGEIAGQYVAPAVAGIGALRALGASPLVASIVAESSVGLLGTSPNEENLFNLIAEDEGAAGALREVLATNPDDSEWTNRARNAVEALIALGAGEAAAKGLVASIENAHKIADNKVVEALFRKIDEADARLKEEQAAGITRMYGGGDTDRILASGKPMADRLRGQSPVATLKGDEIPGIDASDMVATRKNIASWYKKNLQGTTVETSIGPVRFSGKGLKKFTSEHIDETTLASLPAVPHILTKGSYIGSKDLNKVRKDGIVRFHRFESRINVSGVDYDAAVSVAEDREGNLFYSLYKEKAPVHDNYATASGGLDDVSATSPNIIDDGGEINLSAVAASSLPFVGDVAVNEAQASGAGESEEIQVASAAGKFLRELMDSRAAKAGRTARVAGDILDSSYAKYRDAPGIDFNFDRMNTTDEVKAQINIVSEGYATKIDAAKKGVIPLEVTKDLAELLGTDPEKAAAAVRNLPGDVEDLHVRALTMRNLLVASGEHMDDLARAIRDGGPEVSDADYLKFREHLVRHAQLQAQMKGVQTEIARALSSFRIPAEGARASQVTEELLGALGGRGTAREIADKWLATPVDRRAKFAEKSWFAKSRDVVFEIWINGLLSGLRTHQVNTLSNAVFSLWQIPERAVAAGVGMITRSPDRVRMQEAFAMFHGASEGVIDGIRLAWRAWKDEMPTAGLAKIEHQQMKAISPENFNVDPNSVWGKGIDYIGQGIRLPGRALMAEDEFFKSVGYRMELRAQTMRNLLNARDNGTIPDLIADISATTPSPDDARRLTELREIAETRNLNKEEFAELYDLSLNNPTGAVSSGASDYAHIVTFTNELGEFGQALQRLVRSDPTGASRVILPFIRTPTNIIKQFGQRGPAALMMPSVYADFAAGGARRDMAIARIGVGTAVMGWAASLAMEGHITGGGPADPKLRAAWLENYQPYSVKIGDTWVPYGRIEPIALLFGSVADAHDFIRYSDDEEANEKVVLAAAVGVIQNIGSKLYLEGIANVASAYHDPGRYAEGYIANLVGTAMPFSSFLRDFNRALDPVLRETRADPNDESPTSAFFQRILNEYKARYLGFRSQDLPPKRTFWGEERHAYDGSWPNAFNAFATKKVKKSPIDDELVRLGTPLAMPSRRIGSTELTYHQYDRLIQLMNKSGVDLLDPGLISKYGDVTMRQAMNNLVQSTLWRTIESDEAKIEFLKSVRNDFVDAARKALAREDEALSGAMVDEMIDKRILESQSGILRQLGPIQSRVAPPTLGPQN